MTRPDRRGALRALRSRFDSLAERRLILFGGKGGVGKTTLSLLASIRLARKHDVTLVTTDPAGNLEDFGGELPPNVKIETIDSKDLWRRFLDENLESLLELGDRGTYLEREELRRFFELSIPGVDELMGWNRITEIVLESESTLLIVDTAPTGHTLRLLASSDHWHAMELVMESMQEKHREIVAHLARTTARDALDEFLEVFSSSLRSSEELVADASRTAFVPVMTPEPWVVDQTTRLVDHLTEAGIDVPFAILNHASIDCDCGSCRKRRDREEEAVDRVELETVFAPRACGLFRSFDDLTSYLGGNKIGRTTKSSREECVQPDSGSLKTLKADAARLFFVIGKGGVGKTTVATSHALRSADNDENTTLLSVDPAHSVNDVFRRIELPPGLTVETIDTKASWKKLEEEVGESISDAVSGLTPKGFRNVHDEAITRQLLEISPPGADEIFALIRILELWEDESIVRIIIDTAPTGHFVRLLELPEVAGDWVRELMRITLRYKEILSSSSLGEKLLDASRSLKAFEKMLTDPNCVAIPVTRAEPIVITETLELLSAVEKKNLAIPAIVVNGLTPDNDCRCDAAVRREEEAELSRLESRTLIRTERKDPPPVTRKQLMNLW